MTGGSVTPVFALVVVCAVAALVGIAPLLAILLSVMFGIAKSF